MCKRLIFLTLLIVMPVLSGNALAQIDPATVDTGHVYLLDNITGNQVPDDSANSNTGTIVGDPQVVDGIKSNALQFDGIDDGIDIPDSQYINVTGGPWPNRTIVAVFRCADVDKTTKQTVYEEGGRTRGLTIYVHEGLVYVGGWNRAEYNWNGAWLSEPISSNQWVAVALIIREAGEAVEDDKFEMWMDGRLIAKAPGGQLHNHGNDNSIGYTNQNNVFHDDDGSGDGFYFEGVVDEVWILNQALTEAELSQWAGKPWPYAFGPDPADGALHEGTWVTLSWKPGQLAVSHDVYMGDNFDDVNDATRDSDVFRGNQATDFYVAGFPGFAYPEGLVPGTTYYWRIDEVNDADPNSPWKGKVWNFSVPPLTAYNPSPANEAKFVIPDDITLSWTPGFNAKLHYVYFGDDFDQVSNATGALPIADAFYSAGALELEKTYYWRVDEFDGLQTHKGDVWSFTTIPVIPEADDPNLVALWTFDEGEGGIALDWSGHGYHGILFGPQWDAPDVLGGSALDMNGGYVAIQDLSYGSTGLTEVTVCSWVRTSSESTQYIASFDRNEYWRLEINGAGGGPGQVGWDVMTSSGQVDYGSVTRVDNGAWHHVCGVFDNGTSTIYIDGQPEPSATGGSTYGTGTLRFGFLGANSEATSFNGNRGGGAPVSGNIDDVRIYDRALSQEEIQLVMRGDPLLAWNPNPSDGSTPDIESALPLSWSPGDDASQHDVYFGLDKDALKAADSSDTTGIYRGRQNATTYTPPEGVEWGGGPYYWRIDEVNTDGTITKGRIWSFTVADFILVDDFESYTDDDLNGEAIWQHWIDGFGVPDNGAQVGYLLPPYAEQVIVNSGNQSMPFMYDNTAGVTNSEAVLTLTAPRDWTRHGLTDLVLWFRGYPGSVGSFVEAPAGTFTMTASGTDIWGTADEFHYAFKTLTGPGSIVARVNSVQNTHGWAKAGVMIRETLDAGSKHAFACVTPDNGVAAQGRTATDGTSFNTNETGIAAPHWVKLERDASGNFTVTHSTNGSTWQSVATAVPTNIPMTSNVYIGLALTSHNAAATCQAVFSNVTTTGNVSGQWAHQDVGITSNAAEPMYVALSNKTGSPAIVAHVDPAAATMDVWTEWRIPLQSFTDLGINLSDVDSIAIGLGSKSGVTSSGGSGTMFFDDIRLYPPAPQPQL